MCARAGNLPGTSRRCTHVCQPLICQPLICEAQHLDLFFAPSFRIAFASSSDRRPCCASSPLLQHAASACDRRLLLLYRSAAADDTKYREILEAVVSMCLGLGYQAMTEILDAINSNRATSATAFQNQFFPCTQRAALVDAFPVRCRGNGKAWNPKYGTKVQKFQLVTDLRVTPLSVLPFRECRTHDSVLYNETLALVRETL